MSTSTTSLSASIVCAIRPAVNTQASAWDSTLPRPSSKGMAGASGSATTRELVAYSTSYCHELQRCRGAINRAPMDHSNSHHKACSRSVGLELKWSRRYEWPKGVKWIVAQLARKD